MKVGSLDGGEDCISTDIQTVGLFTDEWAILGDVVYFGVVGDGLRMVPEPHHPSMTRPRDTAFICNASRKE